MGRNPKSRTSITGGRQDFDIRKKKHRCADTKYRSKVQFLYGKMKEMVNVESTKDGLLTDALKYILNMESDICKVIGAENMIECKKDFARFLMHEEALWKKEKDLGKWWSKVEDMLNKEYTYQGPIVGENTALNGMCTEPKKTLYVPPNVHFCEENPDENALNLETICNTSLSSEHTSFCHAKSNNYEELQYNKTTPNNSPDDNLKDAVYTPNSFWSPSACSNYIPTTPKGVYLYGESTNESSSSKDNQLYAVENPLEVSKRHIPVDDSMFNDSSFNSSTFLYL